MGFDFSLLVASRLHDLKNDLHILIDLENQFKETELTLNPEQKKLFNRLTKQSLHIRHVVSQFLALFKLDKQYKPSFQEHWLVDFLELLQEQFKNLFPALNFTIDADSDLSWFFDEQLLKVALHNLVVNSLKAGATKITITSTEDSDWLFVQIIDNGPGIPEEMLQLQSLETSQGRLNHGLGFMLVNQICQAHKNQGRIGKIELDNCIEPEQGAIVRIWLP